MKAKFLHLADCHLGYKQYNSAERFNDFAKAFLSVIQIAIDEQVDFVVLSGDLFQKRAIDALTLDHAINILTRLQKAGIPCIAIEGNHELSYYEDFLGWVQFLSRQKLLTLLSPRYADGKPELAPYKRTTGAYIDPKPGIRVYGMKYQGASTARTIAAYAEVIEQAKQAGDHDDIEYTLFLAHTGVEGVLASDSGGLSHRQLAVLKPHVDYLALGHIHKPFEIDNWIYNPGSPETCSFTEASWPERGYFLVEIDTELAPHTHTAGLIDDSDPKDAPSKNGPSEDDANGAESVTSLRPKLDFEPTSPSETNNNEELDAAQSLEGDGAKQPKHIATLHPNPRRPFLRYEIKVDHHPSPEALYEYSQEFLVRKAKDIDAGKGAGKGAGKSANKKAKKSNLDDDAPVVELLLSGVLPFERGDLDLRSLEALLHENFHPLYAQVRNLTRVANREIEIDERLSRSELEQQVLSTLFSQDARYSEESNEWARMAVSLKNLALGGGDATSIIDSIAAFLDE